MFQISITLVYAEVYPDAASGSPFTGSAAFSPNGTVLATSGTNGHTYLWNVASGKLITTITDPGNQNVNSVAFSPDGTILATGNNVCTISPWNVASGKLASSSSGYDTGGADSVYSALRGKPLPKEATVAKSTCRAWAVAV